MWLLKDTIEFLDIIYIYINILHSFNVGDPKNIFQGLHSMYPVLSVHYHIIKIRKYN